jgi:MGT family glycosyltransferase
MVALKAYELGIPAAMLSVVLPRRRGPLRPPLLTTIIPGETPFFRMKIAAAWYRNAWGKLVNGTLCRLHGKRDVDQLTRQIAKRVNYDGTCIRYDTVFSPELGLPELIVCAPDFDFPHRATPSHYHYIGSSVELARDRQSPDTSFPWEQIAADKPLIFCTLGSESSNFKHGQRFFQTVIDAFAAKPEWQLVMAISRQMEASVFHGLAPNTLLVNWAPHLEILKRASLMINHGGLGTVKECILSGVPMLVFPTTSDQPGNAARVVYHKLGMMGDIGKVTAEQIRSMVQAMLEDSSYRERTEAMGRKFKEMDAGNKGVEFVEDLLASRASTPSRSPAQCRTPSKNI